MKKVLIADDELLVRVGLKTAVKWEENGFMVVGEAKNGKEAIELFEKYNPDILLTDIMMPIINGLELIQILKDKKKDLKSVILTHYDDFNYAQEAIKLGASQYILKSDLSFNNLLLILKKLSAEIDNEKIQVNNYKKSTKVDSDDDLEVKIVKSIIEKSYSSKKELDFFIKESKKSFKYNYFTAAQGYIKDFKNAKNLEKTIKNVSSNVFDNNFVKSILFLNDNNIYLILNFECNEDLNKCIIRVKNWIIVLKKNLKQLLDIDWFAGISQVVNDITKLPNLIEQANTAYKQCFFEQEGIVIFNEDMALIPDTTIKVNLKVLRQYIKTFELEKLTEYINSVFDKLYNQKKVNVVKEVFIDFLSYAKIIAVELGLKDNVILNSEKLNYDNFNKLPNFEEVKKYVFDIYNSLVLQAVDNKSEKYSYIIGKSIQYIKNNYKKNISLSDVADYVEISKSYLSLLFKQETGINFSSFLTNYRIEKSKELLKNRNFKIYEIAEKVGFDNPYYFSKVFKDVTGLTCKEYKRANFENIDNRD